MGVVKDEKVPSPPPPAPEEPLRPGVEENDCIPVPLPPAREAETEGVTVARKGVRVDTGVGVCKRGVDEVLPDPPPPIPFSPPPGE